MKTAWSRWLRLAYGSLLGLVLLFGCMLDTAETGLPDPDRYDWSFLRDAKNPIQNWYPVETGKSFTGLKFAFRSMNYAHEVDSNVEAFHEQAGVYPAMVGAYFDLSSQAKNLKTFLDAVHAKGAIPYVTLDPKDWDEPDYAYQKSFIHLINQGDFDLPLSELARTLKKFSHLVLLRFGHEMNGNWYPYAGGGDADGDGKPDGPDQYRQAWRHVHDLFSREGADNLLWVFCPNAENFPNKAWNSPFQYYPGPQYVDFIAVDAYEHHNKKTQSLEMSLKPFYAELAAFLDSNLKQGDAVLKPFGLGEFGTNRKDGMSKAAWYREALDYIQQDERLQFHAIYNSQNGKEDFSLAGLSEALKGAYTQARFQYRLFFSTIDSTLVSAFRF